MEDVEKLKIEMDKLKILNEIYYNENERIKKEYFDLYNLYINKKHSLIYRMCRKIYRIFKKIIKKFINIIKNV